ncbi:hypothetical protein PO909_018928, partial [Leuciscus waleckii]
MISLVDKLKSRARSYFLAHFLMGGKYILWAGKAEKGEVTFPPYDGIRRRFKISAYEP